MSGWADTPTARYLRDLGYAEPEFRTRDQVAKDWIESRGSAPTEVELRQVQLADRALCGSRVINLPDTRSVFESAADRVMTDQRTQIAVLDDEQVNAARDAYNAAVQRGAGTIRPGRSDIPYWSAEKNQGRTHRMISFGPPGGFEQATALVAQWQVEDAIQQARSDASLPRGYPR